MNRARLAVAVLALSAPLAAAADPNPELTHVMLGRRVTFGAGALGTSAGFEGGSWGDLNLTQHVQARWLFGGFTLEGGVINALPLGASSAAQNLTGELRVGWTWTRATVTAGVRAQWASASKPSVQWLPAVSAAYAFDRFGLSGGIFDVQGVNLARISFEQPKWGAGYVAPIGAEVHGRIHLAGQFDLHAQAMAFQLFNARFALFTLSGVFDPGGAP